jgi:hypothetical protein
LIKETSWVDRQLWSLEVNTHDFADKELGKVVPCGVYDLTYNQGWVSVGKHQAGNFSSAREFLIKSSAQWHHGVYIESGN